VNLKKVQNWYEKKRETSAAVRLMLDGVELNKCTIIGSDIYWPVAYLADKHSELQTLDSLFSRYEVEKKATTPWKKNLQERWLLENDSKRKRDQLNRNIAAVSELVTADHLSAKYGRVKNLEAWGGATDISFDCGKRVEVKYIGIPPDSDDLIRESHISGAVTGRSVHLPLTVANYIMFRIAEAVTQLERENIPIRERIVFLAYHPFTLGTLERKIMKSLNEWERPDEDEEWAGFLDRQSQKKLTLLKRKPAEYLEQAGEVLISKFPSWVLIDTEHL